MVYICVREREKVLNGEVARDSTERTDEERTERVYNVVTEYWGGRKVFLVHSATAESS